MNKCQFNLNVIHPSWSLCIDEALKKVNLDYLESLSQNSSWLPGPQHIFNAFSLPMDRVQYVLFGESPYPRPQSANGYAFWDADVTNLWSDTGFSKPVNRATSLRNFLKMLLVADALLDPKHTSQPDIANITKSHLIKTNEELFNHLLEHGFLLLNATLVLQDKKLKDARAWSPFVQCVLQHLCQQRPKAALILFGNIAKKIDHLIPSHCANKLYVEHPYNHSFITNPKVLDFFRPLHLLSC